MNILMSASMKNKKQTKVKPQSQRAKPKKELTEELLSPPFHEVFPITLEFKEDKDKKVCYFQCEEHLKSYLNRYKFKKGSYKTSKTKKREQT